MAERGLAPLERFEVAIAALVLAVAIIGLTLLPLTSSLFVRTLVTAVDAEQLTGLGPEGTLQAAEAVRVFVLSEDAPDLPAQIAGRPAFDASAVQHLVDVRLVLVPARQLALIAALLGLGWLLLSRARPRLLAAALAGAAWTLLGLVGLALLVGLTDFDAFFAWFHSLFFAPGTWQFPADALIIRIFPLGFWMTAAALWAGLVLASSGLLLTFVRRMRFTASTYGV